MLNLEKLGEPPREPDEIMKFFGSGADRIFLSLLKDEKKALDGFNYYLEHEEKHISRIHLHQGIIELVVTS
ncbi:MAG TPA: hypothetical protein VNJ08_04780 [Bacteriovoracaceae bacterium]|nr:hypothetical protein [Bacteriovoracaceae bacterium]